MRLFNCEMYFTPMESLHLLRALDASYSWKFYEENDIEMSEAGMKFFAADHDLKYLELRPLMHQ